MTPVVSSIVNRPPASSSSVYITESVASASLASASMPTELPAVRFSATELAAASMSLIAEMSNSSESTTAIVKSLVVVEPSVEVARTVIVCDVAVSASRSCVVVTTPVVSSIVNRPPASSSSAYITESVTSASLASASMPTDEPAGRFSATEFAAASISLTAEMSNSSASATAIVKSPVVVEPSVEVTRTVIV